LTQTTNARIAGFTFLSYIATYLSGMFLFPQAGGGTIIARLGNISQHVLQMRLVLLCELMEAVCAIVLAVTLYSITKDEDEELALLGLLFRFGEGLMIGAFACRSTLQSLWLATLGSSASQNPTTVETLGAYLLKAPDGGIAAIFFVLGSTIFSFLLLRGRKIPVLLAGLGVGASVLLAVALPLQLAGLLRESVVSVLWIPMLLFEIPLGIWLVIKGVPPPKMRPRQTAATA
jgi:hypothetical protein